MKKILLATAMSIALISSAKATDLTFFCTNHQMNSSANPEGDGVVVHVDMGDGYSLKALEVAHKISNQFYERNKQYNISGLDRDAANPSSYFWNGVWKNNPVVSMTGHLWKNGNVWMYDEHQHFTDGRPDKLATPAIVCDSNAEVVRAALAPLLAPMFDAIFGPKTADKMTPDEIADKLKQQATPPPPVDRDYTRITGVPTPPPATPMPPQQTARAGLSDCDDPDTIQSALESRSEGLYGYANATWVGIMILDHSIPMGINNGDGAKYCKAYFTCDIDKARKVEERSNGPHPLTAACFTMNQAYQAGNPYYIPFKIQPDGQGGEIVTSYHNPGDPY